MATAQQILNSIQTADGVSYGDVTEVFFDVALVDQVNANGNGRAERVNDTYGRIPIPQGLVSVTFHRSGDELLNIALPVSETWSTPNQFINARIAELEAEIQALQALIV